MTIQMRFSTEFEKFLKDQGYIHIGMYDEVVCGLHQYAYTWGLVVGLSREGYTRRYCFETYEEALMALLGWNGVDHPPGPWIVCKGTYQGNVVNLYGPGA